MKSLSKILMFIFTIVLSFMIDASAFQMTSDVDSYIQNSKPQAIVLVSNNILNGEITAYEEENGQNFSSSSPVAISFIDNNNLFLNNKTSLKGCFIHNLSTNKQKVHQIRAP